MRNSVSIVVPTLNEEACIEETIVLLRTRCPGCEIILSDGGSTDRTLEIGNQLGITVVASQRGRGQQLAAGAAKAQGEILWFIHADTVPAPSALTELRQALEHEENVSGYCTITFDGTSNGARILTWIYPRLRYLGLVYGDSAIFVRRGTYEKIGGFRAYPIFEDLDFFWRVRKAGRCVRLQAKVVTSSRRFETRAFTLVFIWWTFLQLLFWLGVHPKRLGKMYSHVRKSVQ